MHSEWYSYHFPELFKIVSDNYKYASVVVIVGDRKQLSEDKVEAVEQVLGDTAQAEAVLAASKSSMGECQSVSKCLQVVAVMLYQQ